MCHTFKHLFICNTFCCRLILLSLSLYIDLALVCCTNPNNVNCLGTIFPNLNFVFASIWAARPVHIESDQYRSCSTVKQGPAVGATPSTPIGEQPKTALWLWVREITWYLYTRGVRGRMKAKQRWFKVTRELCHECFIIFGIMFMTATGLENSPQSFGVYTVSQSRSVVTSAENPAPDNSPQSIGELRNGHVAKKSVIQEWFEKWRDTCVNCVVPQNYDVFPLLMMHKTCSINHGHLADLQKTLPTTDLNKKTFIW